MFYHVLSCFIMFVVFGCFWILTFITGQGHLFILANFQPKNISGFNREAARGVGDCFADFITTWSATEPKDTCGVDWLSPWWYIYIRYIFIHSWKFKAGWFTSKKINWKGTSFGPKLHVWGSRCLFSRRTCQGFETLFLHAIHDWIKLWKVWFNNCLAIVGNV